MQPLKSVSKKWRRLVWRLFIVLAIATPVGFAQTVGLTDFNESQPDRFAIGARFGFNISASFRNLGGFTSTSHPGPPIGGGLDRFYDDGFVRVDSSANAGGLTWFWGYDKASQLSGNDTILMHTANSPAEGVIKKDGDPQLGFELSYDRRLGALGRGNWGVQAAFSLMDLSIHDRSTIAGNVVLTTDTYPLGGTVPPLPPYAGSFAGPGSLINDSPSRATGLVSGGALISGTRALDASLYGLTFGPFVEFPLGRRVSVQFGGGIALAMIDSTFALNESVTLAYAPTLTRVSSVSDADFLVGPYVGARLSVSLSKHVSLFTGAQFQDVGKFTQRAANKQADLELGQGIYTTAGLRFKF